MVDAPSMQEDYLAHQQARKGRMIQNACAIWPYHTSVFQFNSIFSPSQGVAVSLVAAQQNKPPLQLWKSDFMASEEVAMQTFAHQLSARAFQAHAGRVSRGSAELNNAATAPPLPGTNTNLQPQPTVPTLNTPQVFHASTDFSADSSSYSASASNIFQQPQSFPRTCFEHTNPASNGTFNPPPSFSELLASVNGFNTPQTFHTTVTTSSIVTANYFDNLGPPQPSHPSLGISNPAAGSKTLWAPEDAYTIARENSQEWVPQPEYAKQMDHLPSVPDSSAYIPRSSDPYQMAQPPKADRQSPLHPTFQGTNYFPPSRNPFQSSQWVDQEQWHSAAQRQVEQLLRLGGSMGNSPL